MAILLAFKIKTAGQASSETSAAALRTVEERKEKGMPFKLAEVRHMVDKQLHDREGSFGEKVREPGMLGQRKHKVFRKTYLEK